MKELPDKGNDGYVNNDPIGVTDVTSRLDVYLVAHQNNRKIIVDHKHVPVVKTTDGTQGDAAVVTKFTNPASIIQIINGQFATKTATTDLQVRQGTKFIKVNSASISAVKIDEVKQTSYNGLISLTPSLSTTDYKTNPLTFTLGNSLSIKPQVITVDVTITTEKGTFTEVKTIQIQEVPKPLCHIELTNDSEMIFTTSDGVVQTAAANFPETSASFYVGDEDYSDKVTFNCTPTGCQFSNPSGDGRTFKLSTITADTAKLEISVVYDGLTYSKTFTVAKSFGQAPYKLVISPNVIVEDVTENVTIKVIKGNTPLTTLGTIHTLKLNGTVVSGYASGQVVLPVSQFVNKENTITLAYNNTVVDSETIGKIKDGENAKYMQIDVNHP
jgi:hypothetical protein